MATVADCIEQAQKDIQKADAKLKNDLTACGVAAGTITSTMSALASACDQLIDIDLPADGTNSTLASDSWDDYDAAVVALVFGGSTCIETAWATFQAAIVASRSRFLNCLSTATP